MFRVAALAVAALAAFTTTAALVPFEADTTIFDAAMDTSTARTRASFSYTASMLLRFVPGETVEEALNQSATGEYNSNRTFQAAAVTRTSSTSSSTTIDGAFTPQTLAQILIPSLIPVLGASSVESRLRSLIVLDYCMIASQAPAASGGATTGTLPGNVGAWNSMAANVADICANNDLTASLHPAWASGAAATPGANAHAWFILVRFAFNGALDVNVYKSRNETKSGMMDLEALPLYVTSSDSVVCYAVQNALALDAPVAIGSCKGRSIVSTATSTIKANGSSAAAVAVVLVLLVILLAVCCCARLWCCKPRDSDEQDEAMATAVRQSNANQAPVSGGAGAKEVEGDAMARLAAYQNAPRDIPAELRARAPHPLEARPNGSGGGVSAEGDEEMITGASRYADPSTTFSGVGVYAASPPGQFSDIRAVEAPSELAH